MNKIVVKKRDIRSTAAFSHLVYHQLPSKIRKLVSIVQIFGKKDKPYLFFHCERPSVKSVECDTWVAKAKNAINNTCKLVLKYWYTKHKCFCLESKQIYVAIIDRKSHGDIHSFNTVVQKVQAHTNKHNINYPSDVKFLAMSSVI